jgi:hypothetical protein
MTQYYVSTTGNNANDGLATATAWLTLFRAGTAGSVVADGDTVNFLAGTYTCGVQTSNSGAAGSPITYKSIDKWGAKMICTAASDHVWKNTGAYIVIDGFEVTHSGVAGAIARLGIYTTGTNTIVKNCHIHNCATNIACTGSGGSGIEADETAGGRDYEFTENYVHSIGAVGCSFIQGVYLSTSGKIKNNLVHNVGFGGIHGWHDFQSADIVNNTVFNCGYGIIYGGGDYYLAPGSADYINVHNNICYDNTTGIRNLGDVGPNNTHKNNLSFGNGTNWNLLVGTHAGDVSATPTFINYISTGGGDYHLSATSLAIGAGTATYAPTIDLDLQARPQGGSYDIGAYEFVVGGSSGDGIAGSLKNWRPRRRRGIR